MNQKMQKSQKNTWHRTEYLRETEVITQSESASQAGRHPQAAGCAGSKDERQ
ncbi:MAG: hypothetical protein ABL865_08385 [Candidatus Nitrotoga sp.]